MHRAKATPFRMVCAWSDDDGDGSTSEEEEYMRRMLDEEDMEDMEEEVVRTTPRWRRNTRKRPGGTNRTGRTKYWSSTWGRMIRDGDLRLKPADFGWDVQYVPDSEKEGFRVRQNVLVSHYAWFREAHPDRFWLRS